MNELWNIEHDFDMRQLLTLTKQKEDVYYHLVYSILTLDSSYLDKTERGYVWFVKYMILTLDSSLPKQNRTGIYVVSWKIVYGSDKTVHYLNKTEGMYCMVNNFDMRQLFT